MSQAIECRACGDRCVHWYFKLENWDLSYFTPKLTQHRNNSSATIMFLYESLRELVKLSLYPLGILVTYSVSAMFSSTKSPRLVIVFCWPDHMCNKWNNRRQTLALAIREKQCISENSQEHWLQGSEEAVFVPSPAARVPEHKRSSYVPLLVPFKTGAPLSWTPVTIQACFKNIGKEEFQRGLQKSMGEGFWYFIQQSRSEKQQQQQKNLPLWLTNSNF